MADSTTGSKLIDELLLQEKQKLSSEHTKATAVMKAVFSEESFARVNELTTRLRSVCTAMNSKMTGENAPSMDGLVRSLLDKEKQRLMLEPQEASRVMAAECSDASFARVLQLTDKMKAIQKALEVTRNAPFAW